MEVRAWPGWIHLQRNRYNRRYRLWLRSWKIQRIPFKRWSESVKFDFRVFSHKVCVNGKLCDVKYYILCPKVFLYWERLGGLEVKYSRAEGRILDGSIEFLGRKFRATFRVGWKWILEIKFTRYSRLSTGEWSGVENLLMNAECFDPETGVVYGDSQSRKGMTQVKFQGPIRWMEYNKAFRRLT